MSQFIAMACRGFKGTVEPIVESKAANCFRKIYGRYIRTLIESRRLFGKESNDFGCSKGG